MSLTQGDKIGIMDPAFFVSKNDILNWLNSFFLVRSTELNLSIA